MQQIAFQQGVLPALPNQDLTTINNQNAMVPVAQPMITTLTPTPQLFDMTTDTEVEDGGAGEDLVRSYDQMGAIVLAGQQQRSMQTPTVNPLLAVDFSRQLARGAYNAKWRVQCSRSSSSKSKVKAKCLL